MEPKVIKEELVEKEVSSYIETPAALRTRTKSSGKERCKTPDSPEGARLGQAPPAAPAAPPGTPSPAQSPPARAVAAAASPPPSGPPSASSGAPAGQGTGAEVSGAGGRPLAKVRRFLGTLVQFGVDIGLETGERVRGLVLALASQSMSVEDFHHALQDVTNFPLRPFVLPFLRTHMPLLQREVSSLAKANKQTAMQYLRTHEHVIFEVVAQNSPSEPSDIFLASAVVAEPPAPLAGYKRRASDMSYENGALNGLPPDSMDYPTNKRPYHQPTHQPPTVHPPLPTAHPQPHPFEWAHGGADDEWRNIHVMLNCILSMVEKTRRALGILQQRGSPGPAEGQGAPGVLGAAGVQQSAELKKAAAEIVAHAVRQTEERVAEVRRRAEEAVLEVKRQAVLELQKAAASAELRAQEMVAGERAKVERLLLEARKHSEDPTTPLDIDTTHSPPAPSQPAPSQHNSCWNCGRKAHDTCSGCGIARYCGAFCQHRDWEGHQQACCGRDKPPPPSARASLRTPTPSTTAGSPPSPLESTTAGGRKK